MTGLDNLVRFTFHFLSSSRRQHYLSISAPALALPEVEPTPGPGHYNLVNYDGDAKRYMSSSMFVSTTSRWNPAWEAETEIPGPSKFYFEKTFFVFGEGSISIFKPYQITESSSNTQFFCSILSTSTCWQAIVYLQSVKKMDFVTHNSVAFREKLTFIRRDSCLLKRY